MQINGEWFVCDDGVIRPIIPGEVLNGRDEWEPTLFLVDTGADRTVLTAALLDVLGISPVQSGITLGGIGGTVETVEVATRIRLFCDDGGSAVFRANYPAFTRLESLDMCILGRDILKMFAVIVDQPAEAVSLIRPAHGYTITLRS